MKCAVKTCHNESKHERYFVIPKRFYVPNAYRLCENHQETFLDYYYFYDDEGKNIWKREESN